MNTNPSTVFGRKRWQPGCFTLRTMLPFLKLFLLSLAVEVSACSAIAQDPLVAFPKNYSLILDNDVVSVIHVHYGPHEHIGVHDHPKFPTIYVYLGESSPVRFEHDEQPPFRITRLPTATGAFRVSPGRMERHAVSNLGDTASDFLRVELKQLPLESSMRPFRGKAPAAPFESSRAVEFKSPEVDIQRVICENGTRCTMDVSVHPSLFIAFSPLKMTEKEALDQGELMNDGDVRWVQPSHAVSIAAVSGTPAHLLRISLNGQLK